jgi:hypothetical protein
MTRGEHPYSTEAARLARSTTANEPSYYPAIKGLLTGILAKRGLGFDVRVNTSEKREGGGTDMPDVAIYDGSGQFPVLCGEVKLPSAEISAMAQSTAQGDQVGRYLARSNVLLLTNVRAFGLLTIAAGWAGQGPVPPSQRRLEQVVSLWPSEAELKDGHPADPTAVTQLGDLVQAALTRYASITEPEALARILAWQARQAKADLPARFGDAVRSLLDDFGRALGVTFEGEEGEEFFRSSLIQTAYYGLFAGWVLWRRAGAKGTFRWEEMSDYLKIPFLGQLFHEFRHPARIKELRLAQHLDLATEVLGRVVPEAFFSRFRGPKLEEEDGGDESAASAAILYFYEPFLEAFDPELRKELGVWYTPREIVRYQVHKVDRLLRDELGCDRGFADERVVVLDPCCGTGAYLLEVLRCVAHQLQSEGEKALLGPKLRDAFSRRIIGFEILTAPFVISQLQLYLILSELGVPPDDTHRPAVFLTNALTGWHGTEQLKLNFPELQQEHDAARAIKKDAKIIVILGNPPYNRFAGVPLEEEADLVDPYKGIRRDVKGKQLGNTELFTRWGIRKHLLDDLYIRFFRLAEARIGERAEFGVVSFISNSSFLAGRSHPIMRESLLRSFQRVWVDNLHGNRLASERTPQGESCETIFNVKQGGPGIKVGTSVTTLVKLKGERGTPTKVFVRDFWGRAESKRSALLASLAMDEWKPAALRSAASRAEGPRPYEPLEPTEQSGWKFVTSEGSAGYESWPALDEFFPVGYQGVNPNRGIEGSLVEVDARALEARMRDYFSKRSFEDFRRDHPMICEPRARYEPESVRDLLRRISKFQPDRIVDYLVFPLDARSIYYETEGKLLNERRPELWENLAGNEFLIAVPQPRRVSEARPLLATSLFDLHVHDRGSVGFPAEVRAGAPVADLFNPAAEGESRKIEANLHDVLWLKLKEVWGLRGDRDGASAKKLARTLFRAALALCHSPQFEADHKDSLAQDWAHVPIPRDAASLKRLAELGDRIGVLLNPHEDAAKAISQGLGRDALGLAALTRVDDEKISEAALVITRSYYGAARGDWRERPVGDGEPWHAEWGGSTGDLFINDEVFFANVPFAVWRYELGGYPVLKKWLGYRHSDRRAGKALTLAEAEHFVGMVRRISALLALAADLDAASAVAAENCFTAEELGLR